MGKTSLVILGAGGHGLVVADAAASTGRYRQIVFLDEAFPTLGRKSAWEVIGTFDYLDRLDPAQFDVAVGIGDNARRMRLIEELLQRGWNLPAIVHARAIVSSSAKLGSGTVIFAAAVVNPECRLAEGCIVNTAATVDHECIIGRAVHLSPGVHLAGQVRVGDYVWLGIGSCVIQCLEIGPRCIVGAGAAVVRDLPADVTAVGVPAVAM